jgi:mannose-6-phosphate isomerase-like protein (cupin superfamily)
MDTQDVTREDLEKRIARFTDLVRCVGGFPDSDIPGCERTLLNVVGFDPPDEAPGEDDVEAISPVGEKASQASAIPISEGFNLGYVECRPGGGVLSHHHDTNETFVVISGSWRFTWNDADDEYVDLGPRDTVSFPVGVSRRFTCLADDAGGTTEPCLLLAVIAGDRPRAFMRPDFLAEARRTGKYTARTYRTAAV